MRGRRIVGLVWEQVQCGEEALDGGAQLWAILRRAVLAGADDDDQVTCRLSAPSMGLLQALP